MYFPPPHRGFIVTEDDRVEPLGPGLEIPYPYNLATAAQLREVVQSTLGKSYGTSSGDRVVVELGPGEELVVTVMPVPD